MLSFSGVVDVLLYIDDRNILVAASHDSHVTAWHVETWDVYLEFSRECEVASLAFAPDMSVLLAGHRDDGRITVWGLSDGLVKYVLDESIDLQQSLDLKDSPSPVWALVYLAELHSVASGHGHIFSNGSIIVWDLAAGVKMLTMPCDNGVQCLTYLHLSEGLVLISGDGGMFGMGLITSWGLDDGSQLHVAKCPSRVNRLVVLPGARILISGEFQGTLRVWDIDFWVQLRKFDGGDHIRSLLYIAQDDLLLVGYNDCHIAALSIDKLPKVRGNLTEDLTISFKGSTLPKTRRNESILMESTLRSMRLGQRDRSGIVDNLDVARYMPAYFLLELIESISLVRCFLNKRDQRAIVRVAKVKQYGGRFRFCAPYPFPTLARHWQRPFFGQPNWFTDLVAALVTVDKTITREEILYLWRAYHSGVPIPVQSRPLDYIVRQRDAGAKTADPFRTGAIRGFSKEHSCLKVQFDECQGIDLVSCADVEPYAGTLGSMRALRLDMMGRPDHSGVFASQDIYAAKRVPSRLLFQVLSRNRDLKDFLKSNDLCAMTCACTNSRDRTTYRGRELFYMPIIFPSREEWTHPMFGGYSWFSDVIVALEMHDALTPTEAHFLGEAYYYGLPLPLKWVWMEFRVRLVGLERRPELNGLVGTLEAFFRRKDRWQVNLDDCQVPLFVKRATFEPYAANYFESSPYAIAKSFEDLVEKDLVRVM